MPRPLAAERLGSAYLPPWSRHEHHERYRFARAFVAGKRVVDCACGDGTGAVLFAGGGAAGTHAFDLDRQAVATAAARHLADGLSFAAADALRLPLRDGVVDVYVSFETIEHVDEDASFLSEVRRVLSPEGVFICSTPNRFITNPGSTIEGRPWNPFHVREYELSEFERLLDGHFETVELFGQTVYRTARARALHQLGVRTRPIVAVRANQLLKLARYVWSRPEAHAVAEIRDQRIPEFVVAVCRRPRPVGAPAVSAETSAGVGGRRGA